MVSDDINIKLNRLCELLPYYFFISSDLVILDVSRNTRIDCKPCIGKKLIEVFDVLDITDNTIADIKSYVDKHSKIQLISKEQEPYRLVGMVDSNNEECTFVFIGDQALEDNTYVVATPSFVRNGQQGFSVPDENVEHVGNNTENGDVSDGGAAFESLLRNVMDEFPEALFITDSAGHVQLINRQFADIFNLTQSWNFHNKTVNDLIVLIKNSFRQPHKLYEFYERIHNHNATVVRDIFPLQNGNTIEIKFIKCTNSYTNFSGLWIISSITGIMNQFETLKKQKRFFEYILNNIPSDIVAFDKHHRYMFVNPNAIKNDDIRNWIIGKTDYEYCKERNKSIELADAREKVFEIVKESKKLYIEEETLESPTGSQEHYLRYWYPILDENGDIESVLGYGLNITDRKTAEKETADALAKQKELNDLKSNFISLISHQFRTPLSIILSSTQLLEKYNDEMTPLKKQIHFERVMSGVRRMTNLLDDVTLIAQSDSDHITFSPATIEVEELCQSVIDDLSFDNEVETRIEFIKKGTITKLFGDEKLLKHALTNVLSNALQYSESISKVVFCVERIGSDMVFSIQDFGTGIPFEEQFHMFEAFRRGSKVENTSGLGLGLPIAKWFVELHNGTISFESHLNKGSIFTITIPIVNEAL